MVLNFKTLMLLAMVLMVMGTFAQDKVSGISLKDARLDDVVRMLAEQAQINLVLTKEIDKKISIQLKDDMPPLKLLEILLNSNGYNLVKKDNIYTVEEKKEAQTSKKEGLDDQLGITKTQQSSMDEEKNYFQLTRTPVEQVEAKIRGMLTPQGKLEVNRQANSVYVQDTPEVTRKVKEYVEFLNLDPGLALSARMQQRAFKLNRLNPDEVSNNIKDLLTPEKGKAVVDKASQTLFVTDSEEVLNKVAEYLNNADKPEPQVYLRCHVVEISVDADTKAGTEMGDEDGWKIDDITGNSGYNLLPDKTTTDASQFAFSTKDGFFFGASALANRKNTRLLSSPNLLCMNKQASEVQVIRKIPYAQSSTDTQTGTGSTTTTTIQFEEAGIKLNVTPDIYSDGTVKINLNGEVSEQVDTFTIAGNSIPVIKKKFVKSNIMSRDRQTIVIAGILEDAIRKTRSKIPFLGDIPLLGFLFSRETQEMGKTELVIFMHVSIVGDEYLKNMSKQEWKAQQEKFEKYDTEFEFYPHLKEKLEMEKLNPDYDRK